YRQGGHSRADPGTYRPEEEVKAWMARDPIPMYRQRLLDAGVVDDELAKIEAEVKESVAEAERAARAAPDPDPETATTQLWADGGSSWRS
ncbi:MAG: thiamine pyrophosphate-dependent enzyme, partial [Candidatus Limnocylindria bacterium]